MDEGRLRALGREHRPEDVAAAVRHARAAGFANLSLDLIFGLHGQDRAALEADADALLALAPEHLSAYQLTVEERTPLGARQRAGQPQTAPPDEQADLYAALLARTAAAGLEHYEVSSHARPGFAAVHNTLYWSGGEWLGLGPAAHSFRYTPAGGERTANPRNIDAYLAAHLGPAAGRPALVAGAAPTRELLDAGALGREAMWLGLRQLRAGVSRRAFAARFGEDPVARFAAVLGPLEQAGAVEVDAERVRLTARGALLADEVGLRFL